MCCFLNSKDLEAKNQHNQHIISYTKNTYEKHFFTQTHFHSLDHLMQTTLLCIILMSVQCEYQTKILNTA